MTLRQSLLWLAAALAAILLFLTSSVAHGALVAQSYVYEIDGVSYDVQAYRASWQQLLGFLQQTL